MWTSPEDSSTTRAANAQPARIADQPAPSPERRTTAWIGKSVTIKGDVISAEDLMIDGQVEGTITANANKLTIGAGAAILGELHARTVTIGGAVTGRVSATERIEILETGSVDGDIKTPRLAIREGALLRGRIETGAAMKQDPTEFRTAV
jgi:cytoskeletal protein CcmA (bactofilin family)